MSGIVAETIITAHNNADFDALAAMIAASKLHPEAVLIFPGSQEKTLRNFYIESATYLFNFRNFRDIDPASVKRLIMVDTRQKSRISHVAPVLDNPDLRVVAYDHHPDSDDDIPYDEGIVSLWGATTSILIQKLKEAGVTLTEDEATILACGIYEDTGAFTFNNTTEHDFTAAAWLKQQGMDLNVVGDLLHRDLNAEQIAILNSLLESAQTHEINGVPVTIAEVRLDRYVGDFALLVHKMMDMERIRSLFALGLMQDRIHLVSRSRTPDVDVGVICSSMGGGGHAFAASATIKDRTLAQAKDELFALLYTHINPQMVVRDVMSGPPVYLDMEASINEAVDIMTRYSLKALPITEPKSKKCAGLLEQSIADKALSHNLGDIPIAEYMQRECAIINPEADLYPVIEIILGQRQRLVPVVEDGDIIGVITRTDLIHLLIEEPARIPETLLPERSRERNLSSLLKERLPSNVIALLKMAGDMARSMGFEAYVVGGFVRDILLRRNNLDVDLVIEGDGIAFAKALAEKLGGRVRAHTKFKTAVVILQDEYGEAQRIDVATARLEYYEYPAALPTVELSSIKMDLFRRDFTVNALAVHVNPGHFGQLVDFFNAQRDVKDRALRVLHSLSFVEDPTRILRAVRFEQRFNFQIGGQTLRLIKNALKLKLIQKLSGSRLFHEMKLLMEEKQPLACLRRLAKLDVLPAIHPNLTLTPTIETLLEESERVLSWYRLLFLEPEPKPWLLFLLSLTAGWRHDDALSLTTRFYFSRRVEEDFLNLRTQIFYANEHLQYWLARKGPLSELYSILHTMPVEGLLFLMARSGKEDIKRHISLYLTTLRGVSLDITGKDLIAMGLAPGPIFSEIMETILAAKIDGRAPTLLTQVALAKQLIEEHQQKVEEQKEL